MPADGARDRLGGMPHPPEPPPDATEFEVAVPVSGVDFSNLHAHSAHLIDPRRPVEDTWTSTPVVELATEVRRANEAIEAKAAELGAGRTGSKVGSVGRVSGVEGGFVQRFTDCHIYYSPDTGAHEVHGEILRKYLFLNGPVTLGLPLTDETTCPDGRGKFNHFAKFGSIYWTDTTGPFSVQGPVRMRWASEGWEAGPLGYPVRDMQGMGGLTPADNPDMRWTHFQNGMVFSQAGDGRIAPFATVSSTEITSAIFTAFDRRLTPRSYTVGIITVEARPGLHGVDFLGVDDWQGDFYAAIPRTLRLRIRGFVSVPVWSDPTFEIEVGLRFETVWPMSFTFPAHKTVIARLISSKIKVEGIFSGTIAGEIKGSLQDAFTPSPGFPEVSGPALVVASVPTGANQHGTGNLDFLDVILMADGSLNVFVNPLPPIAGIIRRDRAQGAVENALANM